MAPTRHQQWWPSLEVVEVKSKPNGSIDVEDLKPLLDDTIAGIMMTNPNTVGMFETEILEIAKLVHDAGGLLYYDGANLNPLLGKVRPGDMGFDIMHINLHKTFSTPHGGGGWAQVPCRRSRSPRRLPSQSTCEESRGRQLSCGDRRPRVSGAFHLSSAISES